MAFCVSAAPSFAQDIRFFRIGTGSISGVYFPIGGTIASAISNPPGARSCDLGGSCGVPGLIAVAQATLGSVANVKAIQSGDLESALVQADVAFNAFFGKGMFAGAKRMSGLRAIANLYPEAVHIVVRRESPIKSVRDLKGRRVSLDLDGSGTRALALLVLDGYGVDPRKVKQVNSQIGPASDRIRVKNIDAFFFVGGFPVSALSRLARDVPLRLIPIDGKEAAAIRGKESFLTATRIPAKTYRGVGETATVAVSAQWVVSSKVDDETVYGVTLALWHSGTRRLLDGSVPAAQGIRSEQALEGLALPLHPGAARYYLDHGMLKEPTKQQGTN
jgi:TRAP transporter TAXI family solute receptor